MTARTVIAGSLFIGTLVGCGESNQERVDKAWSDGSTAFAEGRFAEAIASFTLAIELDPKNLGAYANRGNAYDMVGEFDKAMADYDHVIAQSANKDDPRLAEIHYNRAYTLQRHGKPRAALADYERAIALAPDIADAHNHMAWILATDPDDAVRDGARAVDLATRECERVQWKDWSALDTLAAAEAEAGRFEQAIETQGKAIAMCDSDKQRPDLDARLKLYRDHKPFRDTDKP